MKDNINKSIGQNIKEKRLEKKMSLEDLANVAHVARQTIYKYENDIITNIPSDKIEAIANALGVTPAYLMGWEEKTRINKKGEIIKTLKGQTIIHIDDFLDKKRISTSDMLKMFNELDEYGIELVLTVIEKEFERCTNEREKAFREAHPDIK